MDQFDHLFRKLGGKEQKDPESHIRFFKFGPFFYYFLLRLAKELGTIGSFGT